MKKNTVILSLDNDEGNLCLDIFIRENDTFGFEEYRKDPENIDEIGRASCRERV